MTDLVVQTHGLRKQFRDKVAVAELSLAVRRGEVFGFLGPNGAGKTTSLKMLLGLIEPTAGSGTLLGAPLGDRPTRARVGFLPEHFRFHDWLPGRQLLRYHGRLHGLAGPRLEARIEALLERVDLHDAAERPLREYSKGMLQRVGLAQAMLNAPEVVFLDEPTSGLDPLGRLLVRDVIADLRRQGTTVFLNSHLLGEVEVTCDRVAFVKQGRVVREMSLAEHTGGLEVELVLGSAGPEVSEGLARFGHGLAARDGAVRLMVESEETLPEMARWLVERGIKIYRIGARRKSLETLFLEIMGDDQRPG
ncbi:MAG: ABC transporter [Candidatus Eisenbacteria bacterium RBG_16_71_46]|nr:MAG: ABC transporter [Candidatus Eisenbacteria bacterium RBG_16_71_46]